MMKKLMIFSLMAVLLVSYAPQQAIVQAANELPNYYFVEDLVGKGQTYPLSCESRSAVDLAKYWGISVAETTFFEKLPVSDNPEKGFVGSVFGTWGQTPPNPYGVHAKPVAKLLRQYGLDATARRGMTIQELKTEIANGRPVIVWVVGRVWEGTPIEYNAKDGETVIVAPYEHTMIAYGYDLSGIYLMDAGSGARQAYAYRIFEASWSVLGNMAITAKDTQEDDPITPAAGNGQKQYVVKSGEYLTMLAKRWGISWQDLAALNGINYPYTIYPGQVLITGIQVQSPAPSLTPELTKPPESTNETEKTTPVPTQPPKATPQPTKTLQNTTSSTNPVYIVKAGDHLMKIARELGLNWVEIASINDLTWPYILHPGQQLKLPGGNDTSESATKPTPKPSAEVENNKKIVGSETYTVQSGDHLMKIARKLKLSWTAIAQLNSLQPPYTLQPGQVLELPGSEAGPPPPPLVEESGETQPLASGETYIVKSGEYLYALAQRFGIQWQVLASHNQISYPYQIYPGQILKIP